MPRIPRRFKVPDEHITHQSTGWYQRKLVLNDDIAQWVTAHPDILVDIVGDQGIWFWIIDELDALEFKLTWL